MTSFLLAANSGGNTSLAKADGGALLVVAEATIGPGTTPATSQPTWWQSYATGNDNNDGLTQATPVKTAAEIKRRWTGGVNGARVQLPAIAITINAIDSAPDATDPWAVLLDVDQLAPGTLVFQTVAQAALHTGTLATVSAFARTSAAGQIIITAADSPNWNVYPMPSLFVDTTKNSVGWLYEPFTGSSANGIITPNRTPATPNTTTGDSQLLATAADAYQLVPLVSIYWGSGARYRCFPANILGNACSATIRRMRIIASPGASFENLKIVPENGANLFVQECRLDVEIIACNFTYVQNCWSTTFLGGTLDLDANNPFFTSGGSYGGLSMGGGEAIVQNDFVFDTAQNGGAALFFQRDIPGFVRIGQASSWGLATASAPTVGSLIRIAGLSASDIFYGKVGGSNPIFNLQMDAIVQARASDSTLSSAFNFDSSTFTMSSQSNAYGFNIATGATVGPTTLTLAHLDAALAAGTGFGGTAFLPAPGAMITNNNG